jgi:hypothetical protein
LSVSSSCCLSSIVIQLFLSIQIIFHVFT